ncbi:peptidase M76 family-domain-containing protein [Peziza echinospora]|nr:peptidase M76 family-domain-containing protein [Peziza echinospora]
MAAPTPTASSAAPPPPEKDLFTPPPPTAPPKGGPEWWRRSFAYATNMGMTPAERLTFEQDRALKQEADQCLRCEQYRDYNLRWSPTIRFLSEQISTLLPPDHPSPTTPDTIKCLPCPAYQSGGFSPTHGILLCQNRLLSRGHTEDTLAHEMMHMYDHLKFQVDWMELKHHACSEIRASSLSGECRWTREAFGRGVWSFTKQHQECVRRRATLSVKGHPKCKDDLEAARVVNSVFDSCFADTRPFDDIYRFFLRQFGLLKAISSPKKVLINVGKQIHELGKNPAAYRLHITPATSHPSISVPFSFQVEIYLPQIAHLSIKFFRWYKTSKQNPVKEKGVCLKRF